MPFITQIQGTSNSNVNLRSTGVIVLKYASSMTSSTPDDSFTITYDGTPSSLKIKILSTKLANVKEVRGCSFVLDLPSITGTPGAVSSFPERSTPKYINISSTYSSFPSANNKPLRGQYYHMTDGSSVDYAVLDSKARYLIVYDNSQYVVLNEALVSDDDTVNSNVFAPTIQYMQTYVTNMLSTRWSYVVCQNDAAQIPAGAIYDDGTTTTTGSMGASSSTEYKIYLVLHKHTNNPIDNDSYDEWITVRTDTSTYNWEKIGNTDVQIDYNLTTNTVTPAYTFSGDNHSHTVDGGGHTHKAENAGNHSHTFTLPTHSHTVTGTGLHSHTFLIGIKSGVSGIQSLSNADTATSNESSHSHTFSGDNHSHTVDGGGHTHKAENAGNHSHTFTLPTHSHTITNSGAHSHSFSIDKSNFSLAFFEGDQQYNEYVISTVTTTNANTGTAAPSSMTFSGKTHSHVVDGGSHSHEVEFIADHTHALNIDHTHSISNSGLHEHTTNVFNDFVINNEILYLSHSHTISSSGTHSHIADKAGKNIPTTLAGAHSHTMSSVSHTHNVGATTATGTISGGSHSHTYTKVNVETHTLKLSLTSNYDVTISSSGAHSHATGTHDFGQRVTNGSGQHSHSTTSTTHTHTVGLTQAIGTISGGSHVHTYILPTITTASIALIDGSGTQITISSSGEHTHATGTHDFGQRVTNGSGQHSHSTTSTTHTHTVGLTQASGTLSGGAHSHTVLH